MLGFILNLAAQSPKKFNYQAVVRNSSGDPVPSGTAVSFRFGLAENRAFGTLLYQETQQKTTNNNSGLVTLEVGGGNKTFGNFPTAAQLGNDSLFMKIEMDPSGGSTYFEVAVVQLLSVPYAIYSSGSGHADDAWSLNGNVGIDSTSNFVGTKDAKGFALKTNNITRIKITSTGLVGIGTTNPTKKLVVTDEVLIDQLTVGKGGGSQPTNTALGTSALRNNTSGYNNSGIGSSSLANNTSGNGNCALGSMSLTDNTTGSFNSAFATQALSYNTTGAGNSAFGYSSLYKNLTGMNNAAVGYNALLNNIEGKGNTAIGAGSLTGNTYGDYNLGLGFQANLNSGDFRYCAAIGAYSTVAQSRTMVFGRVDSVLHWAFGRLSTSSSNYAFQVGSSTSNGNGAYLTTGGTWTNTSDVNLKSDITPVNGTDLLAKIKQLEITRWRYNGTNEYHIGPMAQQFYQLFQTGVDDKGISTVDPAGIALKAIQEQQKLIESLEKRISQLENQLKLTATD